MRYCKRSDITKPSPTYPKLTRLVPAAGLIISLSKLTDSRTTGKRSSLSCWRRCTLMLATPFAVAKSSSPFGKLADAGLVPPFA
ncbi:Uncharacterised protein [Vibrio cholerae]|nr:Uncharacterised protein [Vibrio cholerae]